MPKSSALVDCYRRISPATFLGHSTDICLLLVLLYHIRLYVSTPFFLNFLKLFSGRFYPDTYACTSTIEKSLLLYLNCLAQLQHWCTVLSIPKFHFFQNTQNPLRVFIMQRFFRQKHDRKCLKVLILLAFWGFLCYNFFDSKKVKNFLNFFRIRQS